MKTASRWMVASLLFVGAASLVKAQNPAVTHNTWTSGAAMPTPLAFTTAAVLKNEIYVVGGNNGTGQVADVQIYNPVTNAWSTGVSYPTTIGSASSAVVKNILYVFGGTIDGVNPTNAVWTYNPKTKAWAAVTTMPTARWGSASGRREDNNIVYVIGGAVNASGNDFHRDRRELQSRDQYMDRRGTDVGGQGAGRGWTDRDDDRGRRRRDQWPRHHWRQRSYNPDNQYVDDARLRPGVPATPPARDPLVQSSMTWAGSRRQLTPMISSCRRTNGRRRSLPCRNPSYFRLRQCIRGGSTASAAGGRMEDPSSTTCRFISRN